MKTRRYGSAVGLVLAACGGPPSEPITELPRDLSAAEQRLVESDNRFALNLFREIAVADDGGNVFISPLSVAMALGMAYNGAAGGTAEAMRDVLGLEDLTLQDVNESWQSLTELLLSLDERVDIRLANSIWYRQGFTFDPGFIDRNQTYFQAAVSGLDFDSPEAVTTINNWASEATNGRIPAILDQISPDEVMFLVNAVYFKGSWRNEFDPGRTRDAPFFPASGTPISVPTMSSDELTLGIHRTADLLAVDLPYARGAFSMTIFMPLDGTSLTDFAARLPDRFAPTIAAMVEDDAPFTMPKFRLEWGVAELSDVLTALGMGVAFTDQADFSGLRPERDVFISRVLHKAFVDVNEEGTEAAAVTAVGARTVSAPTPIQINRPFVFVIRERFSGTIVFIGKLEVPGE